jgi:hypothetical protein
MKEKCSNHPEKSALSFCHSCGKYYCDACLIEGEGFYYCYDAKCMAVKSKNEAIILNKIESEKKESELSDKHFKWTFFKDTLLFLLISSPIYFFASFIIADPRFQTLGVMSLFTMLACGKAFIVNSSIGFFFFKLFIKTIERKKEFRQNSIFISIISFIVFPFSMQKIKDIDVSDNVIYFLAFAVSVITLSVFNILFTLFNKRKGDKSVLKWTR